jgi:hypothetical protein
LTLDRSVHLRGWILGLALCLACSDGNVRSGSLPEAADFLPMAGDSAEPASSLAVALDTMGGEQPRLILRCEEGRLGAYVVLDEQAVVVNLDSAPAC